MIHSPSFLERYQAGEHVFVWQDLVALGPAIRSPLYFEDAYAVATETMRRARTNIEIIHHNLTRVDYRFAYPDAAFRPPPSDVTQKIADIERWVGSLPLSLRAFYEQVGSVNFIQAVEQLFHYSHPERSRLPDVHLLGEQNPLVVESINEMHAAAQLKPTHLYFPFAQDEAHKAFYSGGEDYHVSIPNPNADFRIEGRCEVGEYFVIYLRESLCYGGFRGQLNLWQEDDGQCRTIVPSLGIIEKLTQGVVPI